jgi:hypothetical protein
MPASLELGGSFPYATALRKELSWRNQQYAQRLGQPYCESIGTPPVVCYMPSEDAARHGNFLPQTYQAILKNPAWRKRLDKPHTSAWRALPRDGRRRWRELDSSTSSDALLMNVFCFPGTLKDGRVFRLLGVEAGAKPEFGVKARVPLASGRVDRTEIDMRLGDLLVESKLTENDFQKKSASVVESYRDFAEVFDSRRLRKDKGGYLSYQLIRNVLAAYAWDCSFCVMMDARRPDLREAWYSVMSCVRIHSLRPRCKMLTWQELARVLPAKLQKFLDEKYGITG